MGGENLIRACVECWVGTRDAIFGDDQSTDNAILHGVFARNRQSGKGHYDIGGYLKVIC